MCFQSTTHHTVSVPERQYFSFPALCYRHHSSKHKALLTPQKKTVSEPQHQCKAKLDEFLFKDNAHSTTCGPYLFIPEL